MTRQILCIDTHYERLNINAPPHLVHPSCGNQWSLEEYSEELSLYAFSVIVF